MLRTIAVWHRSPFILVPLVVISLGHWALLLHGFTNIHSRWNDEAKACVIDSVFPVFVEVNYLYSESSTLIIYLPVMATKNGIEWR